MAQRRMFSPDIVGSDAFLDMPVSSQALYFHLGMYADDDGFVNPRRIMRMVGVGEDDLKVLIAKRFVLLFENGVIVIKHWKINNLVRKDWYKETQYLEEKNKLETKPNGAYTELVNETTPNSLTQVRLGKDSIGKVIREATPTLILFGEFQKVKLTQEDYDKLLADVGEQPTTTLIEELDQYIATKGKDPYKNHYAVIKAWFRRRLQEHAAKNRPRTGSPNLIEI